MVSVISDSVMSFSVISNSATSDCVISISVISKSLLPFLQIILTNVQKILFVRILLTREGGLKFFCPGQSGKTAEAGNLIMQKAQRNSKPEKVHPGLQGVRKLL